MLQNQTAAKGEKIRTAAGDAFFRASDMARDAADKAKRAASDTASSMTDSVVGLLNEQIGAGAIGRPAGECNAARG